MDKYIIVSPNGVAKAALRKAVEEYLAKNKEKMSILRTDSEGR